MIDGGDASGSASHANVRAQVADVARAAVRGASLRLGRSSSTR